MKSRLENLLAQMTLDEKISLLGLAPSPDGYENYVPAVPRLGIPRLILQDGPAGVAAGLTGVTQLPAPLALAAGWDRGLARRYGEVQGDESRGKGIHVAQGPTVNIARVPQNGRTFEAYGEDPFLTSRISVANIEGIQSRGVMANAKHYAANNQETNRQHVDEIIDERTLREIYLPAFEAAVKEANVASVMGAYNRVNGEHSCQNRRLLARVLKDEWGFEGFVRSDLGAVHSPADAFNAGLDQAKPERGARLRAAVEHGRVGRSTIDEAVRRILRRMLEYGLLDRPPSGGPDAVVTTRAHAALAREVAEQGTVLLKNEGALPLDAAVLESIAVIGSAAGDHAFTAGGGSSRVIPPYVVSPLEGIAGRAGDGVVVRHVRGDEPYGSLPAVPPQHLSPPSGEGPGVLVEYFDGTGFGGPPKLARVVPTVEFGGDGSPDEGLGDLWSARWTGTLTPPKTGTYEFSLTSIGAGRLYVGDRLVVDNEVLDLVVDDEVLGFQEMRTLARPVALAAGRPVGIRVEYPQGGGARSLLKLGWLPPDHTPPSVEEAAEAARASDAAIVFAGYFESEGYDLEDLGLPGLQDRLIEAVAEANPNTIVVLSTGGATLMPWAAEVRGIVETWYPGQECGNAAARVLFGDVNPSGKLPITSPAGGDRLPTTSAAQWPGVDGTSHYAEGLQVGYRWYDVNGVEPLFAFGHGLSYTTFSYRNLEISPGSPSDGDVETVSVDVTNTGARAGAEVVQLYVEMPAGNPPRQLKGFEKVFLEPGQTETVSFGLDGRAFSCWDVGASDWVVPPGPFRAMVGSSSRDIRLEAGIVPRVGRS